MNIRVICKSEISEEALKVLGASSPKQLPKSVLNVTLLVVSKKFDTYMQYLQPIGVNKSDDKYLLYGSISDWEELFKNNPPVELDPFFHVLSSVIDIRKEGEVWKSK